MKNLSLLSVTTFLGLLFTTGCVLSITDDVADDEASTDDNGTDDATDDASTTAETDDEASTTAEETTAEETTAETTVDETTADETTADTTAEETGPAGVCGWDPDGVPPGYYCGFEGTDPGGTPLDCPEGLVEGDPCANTGLTGEGCCDANGDNWFCAEGDLVFLDPCAD